MKNQYIIYVILLFSFQSIAQIKELDFDEKMEMKSQHDKYSWAYKNVFLDYKLGAVSEFFYIPTKSYDYISGDYAGDQTMDIQKTYVDAGFMLSIFNFTLEPRVNLYSKKDYSIYLKAPVTIGLSIVGDRKVANIHQSTGVFNFNLPIMIGFGKGLNSTFSNVSKRGFAFSFGYQFMKTPLVGAKKTYGIVSYSVPLGEPYALRKNWGMPLVQIDFYKSTRKSKVRGYSLAFCPYGNFYLKLAMNFVGTKK